MRFSRPLLIFYDFLLPGCGLDYDKKADVLYISFKRPQRATDSEMLEDGVLLRYKNDELVGLLY